jgi:hypothetical protein
MRDGKFFTSTIFQKAAIDYLTDLHQDNGHLYEIAAIMRIKGANSYSWDTRVHEGKIKETKESFRWEDLKKWINQIDQGNPDPKIAILTLQLVFDFDPTIQLGHANVLVFDITRRKIEHFEPHGSKFSGTAGDVDVNATIDKALKEVATMHFIGWTYLPPVETCPMVKGMSFSNCYINEFGQRVCGSGGGSGGNQQIGLQSLLNTYQPDDKLAGTCAMWSLWFIHLRLSNPGSTATEVLTAATELFQKDKFQNMARFIESFIFELAAVANIRQVEITSQLEEMRNFTNYQKASQAYLDWLPLMDPSAENVSVPYRCTCENKKKVCRLLAGYQITQPNLALEQLHAAKLIGEPSCTKDYDMDVYLEQLSEIDGYNQFMPAYLKTLTPQQPTAQTATVPFECGQCDKDGYSTCTVKVLNSMPALEALRNFKLKQNVCNTIVHIPLEEFKTHTDYEKFKPAYLQELTPQQPTEQTATVPYRCVCNFNGSGTICRPRLDMLPEHAAYNRFGMNSVEVKDCDVDGEVEDTTIPLRKLTHLNGYDTFTSAYVGRQTEKIKRTAETATLSFKCTCIGARAENCVAQVPPNDNPDIESMRKWSQLTPACDLK